MSPTIFSPTGRLHPVERTMEQVRQPDARSNLVVALHCQDGMLMLSTVPLSPYLNTTITPFHNNHNNTNITSEKTTTTTTTPTASLFLVQNEDDTSADAAATTTLPIMDLTPGIIGATAGKALDCQVLRLRMQALVQQLVEDDLDQRTFSSDDETLVSKVARTLADQLQAPTQKSNSRQGPLLAVSTYDIAF
jgi:20S proteasome alpha/beta subunit